jgi:hypothetical protein
MVDAQSDVRRAAVLRWRGMPPEIAMDFMARLRAGSTIKKLTGGGKKYGPPIVPYKRFEKHCELHTEWAAEACRISKINANAGRGALNRNRTHCVKGHSLSEHGRVAFRQGFNKRQCRECERIRQQCGHPIRADVLVRVTTRTAAGALIDSLTKGGSSGYLVLRSTLVRHRRENPEFDRFVIAAAKDNNSRGQRLRLQRVHNAGVREAIVRN